MPTFSSNTKRNRSRSFPIVPDRSRSSRIGIDTGGTFTDFVLQAPAGELRVWGDAESMTQIADNLVDNAIKYTGDGGVVTLALRREAERGVLEVRDTGIGIPPEDLERIFERFYRVDKARSRALGGTGLGLSIVKHLAQAMNGRVSVTSESGRGSVFRVELQLAEPRGELLEHRSAGETSGRKLA